MQITIVTPVFNAEKNIVKCIENVNNQTFKNFEHIIIDGASTDLTKSLILEKMKIYNNIRLVSEPDLGIYDAMNKGILLSKSKWLYFLGSDDFFIKNDVLEKISTYLNQYDNNIDILYGNVFFKKLNRIFDGKFYIEKILKHNICHQAIFYNISTFNKIGNFNLDYKIASDYEFNLRSLLSGIINTKYIPLDITYFEDNGTSSYTNDEAFIKEYPGLIINETLNSINNTIVKSYILFTILRKLILRRKLKALNNYPNKSKLITYLLITIILSPFWLLFYLLRTVAFFTEEKLFLKLR
jgi:glycosyltransferase involved in cell wall biosynthesis